MDLTSYLASMGYSDPISDKALKTLHRGQYSKIWQYLRTTTRPSSEVQMIRDNLRVNKVDLVSRQDDGGDEERATLLAEKERLRVEIEQVKRSREQLERDVVYLCEAVEEQQSGQHSDRRQCLRALDALTLHNVFSGVLSEDRSLMLQFCQQVQACRDASVNGSDLLQSLESQSECQAGAIRSDNDPLTPKRSAVVPELIYGMQLDHMEIYASIRRLQKTKAVADVDVDVQWRIVSEQEKMLEERILNGNVIKAQLREVRLKVHELDRLCQIQKAQLNGDLETASSLVKHIVEMQRDLFAFSRDRLAPMLQVFKTFDDIPETPRSQLNNFSFTGAAIDGLSIYQASSFAKLVASLGQILEYPRHSSVDDMLPFAVRRILVSLTKQDGDIDELLITRDLCSDSLSVAADAQAVLESAVVQNDLLPAIQSCRLMIGEAKGVQRLLEDWRTQPAQRSLVGAVAKQYASVLSSLKATTNHL